jgi:hypothetical protein
VCLGLATQEWIDHGHFDRLGPDCIYDIGPPTSGNPIVAFGIDRAKAQQALGRNCSEEQMSQIGP